MSFNNNFTKIFNISKEMNHKRSIDSSRSNNSFINKFESKDSLEKNNNNYVGNINNNNNFIQEQKIKKQIQKKLLKKTKIILEKKKIQKKMKMKI